MHRYPTKSFGSNMVSLAGISVLGLVAISVVNDSYPAVILAAIICLTVVAGICLLFFREDRVSFTVTLSERDFLRLQASWLVLHASLRSPSMPDAWKADTETVHSAIRAVPSAPMDALTKAAAASI